MVLFRHFVKTFFSSYLLIIIALHFCFASDAKLFFASVHIVLGFFFTLLNDGFGLNRFGLLFIGLVNLICVAPMAKNEGIFEKFR